MALNFSHRPMFQPHLSEENLVSPMRIVANGYMMDGIPERSGDVFVGSWHSHRAFEDCYDYRRDRVDRGGSPECASNDILDILPSDPFGMDISSTFTAITGLLEDFWGNAVRYQTCPGNTPIDSKYNTASQLEGYTGKEPGKSRCEGRFGSAQNAADIMSFDDESILWGNADRFQAYSGDTQMESKSNTASQLEGYTGKEPGKSRCEGGFGSAQNAADIMSFDNESIHLAGQHIEETQEICCDEDEGAPPAGLVFALRFLGVQDLLSVEMVCKSLRFTVRSDPLLWRSIHIGQPLNERITDDALFQLTSRAQGNLQSLSLVECPRITDDALKRVLETNLRLTKLCVPRCMRLSIEGIVNSLKAVKSEATPGIKHLRIGGRYSVTHDRFEELKSLLDACSVVRQSPYRPHFYHLGNFYLLCDDDRPIDIEVCPRCQKLRLVYDCPAEGCQGEGHAAQLCRACTLCIQRCVQCGRCITDNEYEETFCLDLQCSDCFKQQLKCQEMQDTELCPTTNAHLHDSSRNSCLHG